MDYQSFPQVDDKDYINKWKLNGKNWFIHNRAVIGEDCSRQFASVEICNMAWTATLTKEIIEEVRENTGAGYEVTNNIMTVHGQSKYKRPKTFQKMFLLNTKEAYKPFVPFVTSFFSSKKHLFFGAFLRTVNLALKKKWSYGW